MSINLHHLRLFTAVVDKGGFSRAAVALNLSQPAISKAIGDLERDLNVRLLERGGRFTRLTDAGAALYARSRELFGVERVAIQELRELRGLKRGALRVAASTTIATYLLPPILSRFHRRHPGVRIRSVSANTRAVLRMLLEFRVDVALVEGPVSHPQVEVHPWLEDELVVIAPPDHAAFSQPLVDVAFLATQTFLVREPGSGTREVIEEALARHGVETRHSIRVGGTEAIKQGVAAGLGIAIVSRAAAADQLALGKIAVVDVEGFSLRRMLTRLTLRGRTPTASARELELLLDDVHHPGALGDASGDAGSHVS